ncbi:MULTISPECIES: hypothetical protein [unclassified Streptococcus]|uniref:hypothetical protein n=1 Tax=unclassified Streptococcus TaxID=2608887 RepID=UPI001072609B|nr:MULTISPECIES: hypothetical protein [unclassified Streptococcus]MBF0787159.1 hypothetical protein [Streptococcus sp. 19428wC2_LYSM12]MCQ9212125.1 hypothetical protein [Streptococcus sp. B01]MCQ9213454.1 hypothetical protein [Streptococcus sp. O1]TFV05912.1 hypothetical protein E4T79_04515 [Streptococcus sp. LYSM12]
MKLDVSELTKSLATYNPVVNQSILAINKALLVLGNILLAIFLLLEMMKWYELVGGTLGKKLPMKLWLEIGFKYLACWLLMQYSAPILDGLMWLLDSGVYLISKAVKAEGYSYTFELGTVGGPAKIILNLIGGMVSLVANVISKLISFLRYMELYFLKGIAPVLVPSLVNEMLRPIAITFLKYFSSYVLIALGLAVISVIYAALFSTNFLLAFVESRGIPYVTALLSILQGIIYIMTIVRVGRRMRHLLGV